MNRSLSGVVSADMLYFKLFLIGCLMLAPLKFNTKGLLPEVPVGTRASRTEVRLLSEPVLRVENLRKGVRRS